MAVDFEATELNQAGMDDDIYLQDSSVPWDDSLEPIYPVEPVQAWEEYRRNYHYKLPAVGDDVDDFRLTNIDWTFGLSKAFPGMKKLVTFEGPVLFWRGFVHGSAVANHTTLDYCDDNINSKLVQNLILANNKTGDLFRAPSTVEFVFSGFDLLLVVAGIADGLYPITYHCWGASEWIIAHYAATIG